ncbi:sodium-dependent nutrient amino acid transporter 1-like isoform X2 [Choristoneura fumiferana]|uniref:sodium-dependent nutrient amino acid transporter 1-like isoform X2 n=1 Tax=Choristoneura fumiferana TaxID=7141 RepID=UPI003D15738F
MAVAPWQCEIYTSDRSNGCQGRTSRNGRVLKSAIDFIKTQICTVAIALTLFNSVRLPREAFRYGTLPYLVVYSLWLVLAALPASLLQLAVGQLSQQDPVGVWRAVPILRGVGHLKVITSYICCIYMMVYAALSTAYLLWIGKGSFPLKDCTRLQITPHGYENKMNASECFNSTFLAPFTLYPQYLGIMAIIIFILWFFVPILLYRLRKSLKVSLSILAPLILIFAIVLCTFLSDGKVLTSVLESCQQWMSLSEPYIWHSAMVQALLSTQVAGGYLISAGGTVYRHADVRWASIMIIIVNLIAGWLWVFMWESIGGESIKDTSFISILVLIYQSSVTGRRDKEWPLLAFGMVLISSIITVLILLFPVFNKLCRVFNDHWRLTAATSSALGTTLTIAVLTRGVEVATVLDELVVPVLATFTTAVEIVGFVFIYGWYYLTIDIEFLTGKQLACIWIIAWWTAPILMVGVTGWWLRTLLKVSWSQTMTLWPLVGVFIGLLVIVVIMAAIAVAKEEQFNLFSKIASAFNPSRLWGPEEPMARYIWMSQRCSVEPNSENKNYPQIIPKINEKSYEDWLKPAEYIPNGKSNFKNGYLSKDETVIKDIGAIYTKHSIPRSKKKKKDDEKFRSPNICIAKTELGGPLACNCNRHFTLNVPDLRKVEVTTSL